MECLKKKPKYLVTHSGIPHRDDMFCYGIYKFFFGDIKIVRKSEPTLEELNDPDIHVFDVGGVFNLEKNNFDHHQRRNMPSSCILVWRALMPKGTREEAQVKFCILDHILKKVSDADNGKFSDDLDGVFLRNYVKFFPTNDQAFEEGAEACYKVLVGKVSALFKKEKFNIKWLGLKSFGNNSIKLIDDTLDFIPEDFKIKAKEEGVKYLILKKHTRKNAPVLYSLNGMIPYDLKRQLDLSNDGRSASYKDIDGAINHALELSIKKHR